MWILLSAFRPPDCRAVDATSKWRDSILDHRASRGRDTRLAERLREVEPRLSSAADLHAHAARGAFDHPHGRLDRVRVEVVHLDLGDRANLRARDLPDLVLVRYARALLDAGLLADEV